ncbi:DUF4349 domain-containing protein [Arcicella aquatica]|uniref:DUF4349 domain-containing protein n=1 Tax=Arcicella aquatica TaxID=217141 RepID=A0ABU5QHY7_9BACT|nr:DUF4349 domain-containing protein [Arcicella aquatica]MEA5256359.1 DUF4349 domain-containing protein [Arcicella aquatica]
MKTYQLPLLAIAISAVMMFMGCSEKKAETTMILPDSADTITNDGFAGLQSESTKDRKFIKTGELKGKVKNVQEATNQIEDIVEKYDGFVTHAELENNVIQINDVEISEDSVLHNKAYVVVNRISMRVPNQYFEKALREIQPIMTFVDYKNITADDVSFSLMAKELTKKRFSDFEKRYQKGIAEKGKRLSETARAEENLLDVQTQADMNKVQTLSLKDQINYSNITVEVYQPMTNTIEVSLNMDNSFAFKPNLFLRIWSSLKIGWYVFEEIVVFLSKLWLFILIGFGTYWIYKTYRKSIKD